MSDALQNRFREGLDGKEPRDHQLRAVRRQLAELNPRPQVGGRYLHQHAPGSGKTETILALCAELLRRTPSHPEGRVHGVVVLNYATELEEQMLTRAAAFWRAYDQRPGYRRIESSSQVSKAISHGEVVFSLLQKFSDESLRPAAAEVANGTRLAVIIDEAHRGVPNEGTYITNVEQRFGSQQIQIFFTATPKVETLKSHGLQKQGPHGMYYKAFDIHTQADACSARYVMNPLERYVNSVSELRLEGQTLAAFRGKVSMRDFNSRLHRQKQGAVMEQQARFILNRLPEVHEDMPSMTHQDHRIKHLVVLDCRETVYEMSEKLKDLAAKRRCKNNLGSKLVIGTFFSGYVKSHAGEAVQDKDVNKCPDAEMLAKADVILCCQKFLAGWDEWRVCSVFLCKRSFSEEHLQQLLSRATRARPGTGKRRPFIWDLANHPDDVCAAISKFWAETRHHENPVGELVDLRGQIQSMAGADLQQTPADGATKLLLRAAIVRFFRTATAVSSEASPLSFSLLQNCLERLNASLARELFGGSEAVARAEARETAAARGRLSSDAGATSGAAAAPKPRNALAALNQLRASLQLGRHKRTRAELEATPAAKKRRGQVMEELLADTPEKLPAPAEPLVPLTSAPPSKADSDSDAEAPATAKPKRKRVPVSVASIDEGLRATVRDAVAAHKKALPDGSLGIDRELLLAERLEKLQVFKFQSAPLARFYPDSLKTKKGCPLTLRKCERQLAMKLSDNIATLFKASWEDQHAGFEQAFRAKMSVLPPRLSEAQSKAAQYDLEQQMAAFSDVVDEDGISGHVVGWAKRNLRKSLTKILEPKL